MVAITAVAAVFSIVANLGEIDIVRKLRTAFLAGNVTAIRGLQPEALSADDRQSLANTLVLVSFIVTGIIWMVWQHRAHRSLRGSAEPGSIKFSATDAVVWWIIPVANFWMPFRVNRELHSGSAKLAGADPQLGTVGLWWAAHIGAGLVTIAGGALARDEVDAVNESYFSRLIASHSLAIVGRVVLLISAVLAITLVRKATTNLEAAYRRRIQTPAA